MVWELPSFAAVPTHPDPTTYMICISTRSTSPSSFLSPALLASTSATRSTASWLDKAAQIYPPTGCFTARSPRREGRSLHGRPHAADPRVPFVDIDTLGEKPHRQHQYRNRCRSQQQVRRVRGCQHEGEVLDDEGNTDNSEQHADKSRDIAGAIYQIAPNERSGAIENHEQGRARGVNANKEVDQGVQLL